MGLEALAREAKQPAGRIADWRAEFLAGGREAFEKSPPTPAEDHSLSEAQRSGRPTLDIDILRSTSAFTPERLSDA